MFSGARSRDAPEQALLVNHEGTRHLLDWLRPVSRGARIVYASSVAVHDRDRPPNGPISENSPLVPRTAYGRTKLEGEKIISLLFFPFLHRHRKMLFTRHQCRGITGQFQQL